VAVERGVTLELDPAQGLDGVEAPARARRPAHTGGERGRGGDDGAVRRLEGVAREEVEQVKAAAEDVVVDDKEHRVQWRTYRPGTTGGGLGCLGCDNGQKQANIIPTSKQAEQQRV
jgi:hypothetical protein